MKIIIYLLALVFFAHPAFAERELMVALSDENHLLYDVPSEVLVKNKKHGQQQGRKFVVPRMSLIRSGCSLQTPWLDIGGSAASLNVYPRFNIRWWGELGPESSEEADLMEIRIYRKGQQQVHDRFFLHSGQLIKRWISTMENGDMYFHGHINNDFRNFNDARGRDKFPAIGSSRVPAEGQFAIAICNIQQGTELTLDSLLIVASKEQ